MTCLHQKFAILIWLSGILIAIFLLFVGEGQTALASYVTVPNWLIPALFFTLGLMAWAVGGQVEQE